MAITLLDMLLNAGLINREQFDEALKNRVLYGGKIGTSLIELGYVKEEVLARFLSKKLAVPYVPPKLLLSIPEDVIGLIPQEMAVKFRVIPISLEKKRLNLVMADPTDLKAIDEMAFITGFIIRPLITPEVRLAQALSKYYHQEMDPRYLHIIEMIDSSQQGGEARQAGPEDKGALSKAEQEASLTTSPPEEELEEIELIEEVTSGDWPNHVRRMEPDELSRSLAFAESGEEIVDLFMLRLGKTLERVALFRIKDEKAIGWKGFNNNVAIAGISQLSLSLVEPSALRTVTESAGYYLGKLKDTPVNHLLHDLLGGGKAHAVLLMPLFVGPRVVHIVYAEDARDMSTMVPELQKLLTKASLAFEMLIFRERILML